MGYAEGLPRATSLGSFLFPRTTRDIPMPEKMAPRVCTATGMKGGWYRPGHDQKLRAAIEEQVGGPLELKGLIEKTLNSSIRVKL